MLSIRYQAKHFVFALLCCFWIGCSPPKQPAESIHGEPSSSERGIEEEKSPSFDASESAQESRHNDLVEQIKSPDGSFEDVISEGTLGEETFSESVAKEPSGQDAATQDIFAEDGPSEKRVPETPPEKVRDASPPVYKRNIREIGTANDSTFIEITDVLVKGRYAYVCTGVEGFLIYDLQKPGAMKVIGKAYSKQANPGFPRCQNSFVDGNYAFIANHSDEFQPTSFIAAFDISNPTAPKEVASYFDKSASFEGFAVRKGFLFATSHRTGLWILSFQKNKLRLETKLTGFKNAWGVALLAQHLLVADGIGGLKVVDIYDPKKPKIVATLTLPGFARRVVVKGNTAYLALGTDGFVMVDITQPTKPKMLAQVPTSHTIIDLEVSGDYVFATNWVDLRVYNVKQPKSAYLEGRWTLTSRTATSFTRNLAIGLGPGTSPGSYMMYAGEWEGLRSVEFKSTGRLPIAVVTEHRLFFPKVTPGKIDARSIKVSNDGGQTLQISAATQGPFTVLPKRLSIAPGKSDVLEVRFAPTSTGSATGGLSLNTNDPNLTFLKLPLLGNQSGGAVGDVHPDFTLRSLDGKNHSLKSLRGKVVMLSYFATF